MKPSAFEYHAPRELSECVALLVEHEDECKLLAGGQSLVPLMNLRMAVPEVVIDLNRLQGLSYIREDDGMLAIGALTRYVDVEESPLVARHLPILVQATAEVGYPAVRSRGTIGGTLAHADPVAEWPCIVRTLDAELVAVGPNGTRTIPAADFFQGMFTTALDPAEVLTEVRLPLPSASSVQGFEEFAKKTGDYAVVAVTVDLELADGAVASARAGYANLADRPVRAPGVEALLTGLRADTPAGDEVVEGVRAALAEWATDADRAERVGLAGILTRRAVNTALEGMREGAR